jgi:hypothetical protein
MNFWFGLCSTNSRASIFVADQIQTELKMPKEDAMRSGVSGHAPRKALAVKKAIKKGPTKSKKGALHAEPPKKPAPAALEVVSADEHVSASPTPPTPRSPRSPRSPSYVRESWWDSFGDLSRRIDETAAAVKDLKEYVKRLEEEGEKNRAAGSVFGKRD